MTAIPIKVGNHTVLGKIRLFDKTKCEYIDGCGGWIIIEAKNDGKIECYDDWREQEDGCPLNADNLEIHIEPIE